ncbi:MAG: RecX family transcriptional regulator, partial [Candidatus Dormibacteraeota bacterium]|nr:RecX family transcriptional regulator [Candidatus Dormibacteraeota bacterium]
AHTEAELERKLRRRGCEPPAVAATLAGLKARGYIDDAAFARALAARRARERGPALIAAELSARGVSRAAISAALEGIDPESQLQAARRLATRSSGTDRALVAARLSRRGFDPETVRAAIQG